MDRVDLSALFLHSLALWFVAVGGPFDDPAGFPPLRGGVTPADDEHGVRRALHAGAGGARPQLHVCHADGLASGGVGGRSHDDDPGLVPATTLSLLVSHLNQRYPNAAVWAASSTAAWRRSRSA